MKLRRVLGILQHDYTVGDGATAPMTVGSGICKTVKSEPAPFAMTLEGIVFLTGGFALQSITIGGKKENLYLLASHEVLGKVLPLSQVLIGEGGQIEFEIVNLDARMLTFGAYFVGHKYES